MNCTALHCATVLNIQNALQYTIQYFTLLFELTIAPPHDNSRPAAFRLQLGVRVLGSGSITEVQPVGKVWPLDKVGTGGHFLHGTTVSGAGGRGEGSTGITGILQLTNSSVKNSLPTEG